MSPQNDRRQEVPETWEEKKIRHIKRGESSRGKWPVMPRAAERVSQKRPCNAALVSTTKGHVGVDVA